MRCLYPVPDHISTRLLSPPPLLNDWHFASGCPLCQPGQVKLLEAQFGLAHCTSDEKAHIPKLTYRASVLQTCVSCLLLRLPWTSNSSRAGCTSKDRQVFVPLSQSTVFSLGPQSPPHTHFHVILISQDSPPSSPPQSPPSVSFRPRTLYVAHLFVNLYIQEDYIYICIYYICMCVYVCVHVVQCVLWIQAGRINAISKYLLFLSYDNSLCKVLLKN